MAPLVGCAAVFLLLLWSLAKIIRYLWWRKNGHDRLMQCLARFPIIGSVVPLFHNLHRLHDFLAYLLQSSSTLTLSVFIFGMEIHPTADPANVEYILKSNFRNFGKGRRFCSVMHDLLGDSIFNSDGDQWKFQRKLSVHGFSSQALRTFIFPAIQTEIASRLLPILASFSSAATIVDLQDIFLRFAFDNVCQTTVGIDPACLSPSMPELPLVKAFDDASELITNRFLFPNWLWQLKRYLRLGSERRLAEAIRLLKSFAGDVVRKRKAEFAVDNSLEGCDLLSRLIRSVLYDGAMEADAASQQSTSMDQFFEDMIISFMFAGRDSSSVGLTWFFWLLMRHPDVEEKIYEEVRRVVESRRGGGSEATEEEEMLTYEEVKEMQYLNAAIHEALRLYPPVPMDIKEAEENNVLPDGTRVGKGAQVTYHPFAMARVESVWGKDCRIYRPERWLAVPPSASDKRGGEFVQVSPFKFPVFQAGPRTCLGKDMALLLMKCIAAAVILRFRFEFAPTCAGLLERRPCYNIALTLKMTNGLPARIFHRRTASSATSSSTAAIHSISIGLELEKNKFL